RQEHSRDELVSAADQEVGDAPADLLQPRQPAPTGTLARRPRTEVADPVTDEWHGVIEQVRHQDAAHLTGSSRAARRLDLQVEALPHDVQPSMRRTLAGDDADLAAAVAVEDRSAEDLFEQYPILVLQHLGGGHHAARGRDAQPPVAQELREQ